LKIKPDDGHIWPKHVVLILTLKNMSFTYHMSCVFDYPLTYLVSSVRIVW